MMNVDLLKWIREESEKNSVLGAGPVAAIRMILLRAALEGRGTGQTSSVELSLQVYERSVIYRQLAKLSQDRSIVFCDRDGSAVAVSDQDFQNAAAGAKFPAQYVRVA